jgi:hypothetical protein
MAEPSSTASPTKKKTKAKPSEGAPPPPPPPPEAGGLLTAWRTWAVGGVVLIGGIVAWKLIGSTYRSDVETICNAEKGSGFTVQKDMSKVTQYVRSHLATPEGNELFSSLSDAKMIDRAKRMRDEAAKEKIASCPIVASYERVAAEGDYRADMQRLCSNVTFPKLGELDDEGRLAKLEDWIDQQAKSPRTKELADPLRLGTSVDRAKLLRDSASKMDIFTCDVAKTLEGPILPSKGKGQPVVRPYSAPQINGVLAADDLAKALVEVTPAMNACYKKGLDTKPDLAGKLAVKVKIDPSGKITGALPAEVTVPERDTVMCILKAIQEMKLPQNPGPLVTALIPLELTTAGIGPAPAAASGAPAASSSAPAAPPSAPASTKH